MVVTVGAAIAAAGVLYLVFRAAQERISSQTLALVEATRRDPFTGMLNHGALVETIGAAIERLRGTGGGLEIAILDIDNFRILNDTWGHAAGDEAIRAVQAQLEPLASAALRGRPLRPGRVPRGGRRGARSGRSSAGPRRVRRALADVRLRFGDSNDLPLTVSGAVARFPEDGDVGHRAARQRRGHAARGPGRRRRRRPGRPASSPRSSSPSHTFDVFQGLILAVDAKDRYTKRHSEDVARYAMFIGSKLGIGAEEIGILRLAGLLHDVGKVGIPDQILRKPGKLTDGEYEIVKQHVALGDSILRDLPDLDAIRAGVRHHHERWDGRGYLHAPRRRRHPAVRPDPRGRRHVLGDDDQPAVPQGARPARGAPPARGRGGHAARRAARGGVPRRARDGREPAAPRRRGGGRRLWLPGARVA